MVSPTLAWFLNAYPIYLAWFLNRCLGNLGMVYAMGCSPILAWFLNGWFPILGTTPAMGNPPNMARVVLWGVVQVGTICAGGRCYVGMGIAGSRKCANRRGYQNLDNRRIKKMGVGVYAEKYFF